MTAGNGSGGSISDLIGRGEDVTDQTAAVVAACAYLGAGTVVKAELPKPDVNTASYGGGGSADYATYLDRWNRPVVNT